ncbi:MAG: bifunctional 3-phosphoshikimate 1-carboxyvinyltransferase/cytidylate kinase [Burkholderiaceae bacterium]
MFATGFLDIPPLTGVAGELTLPGSKSISNRVLLLAALCHGSTTLHDLLDSDDTRVMLAALRLLGCSVQAGRSGVTVEGLGGVCRNRQAELFLGNAGTAIRPLTAALAVLGGEYVLRGVPRMHERPIGDLVDALRQLGCHIDYLGKSGFPPLHIGEPTLQLERPIRVRGDVSSQFLTALLMALPLVARHDLVIEVQGELISRPYVEITLNLLARFGVQVARQGWQHFTIPANSQLRTPGTLHVEADASSASYFVALGAIAGSSEQALRIAGVGADSIQGDIRFIEAARQMGARIDSGPAWLEVSRDPAFVGRPLQAIDLDCNHIPDAAMTLAILAMFAKGTTTLRNIASWRVKETDRITAMATELRKFGATVVESPDSIAVTAPATVDDWRAASVQTYDDHRMAMCFSLMAFNPAGLPVRILDPACVAKTYPDYFEDLFAVARTPTVNIPVICVDGPTASGKGTVAAELAKRLGYHFLDSGALYRITALAATRAGLALDASGEQAIAALIQTLAIRFDSGRIKLDKEDVSELLRTEQMGMNASRVSALPSVRQALVALQHAARRLPGLVADGRDMGTVIFPQASLKVFLTANAARRAERRHKQLISKGIPATIESLRADLEARDARDSNRGTAPLKPASDALLLDNSDLTVQQSVDQVLAWWQGRQPFQAS